MDIFKEFDRQVETLINKGYPSLAHMSVDEFTSLVLPLREKLPMDSDVEIDLEKGTLPFVIVIQSSLISTDAAMAQIDKDGKHGITKLYPHEPTDFQTIEHIKIPSSAAYVLIDIDRGKESINLPPSEAMPLIEQAQRTPLTIDEGVAIVTHYPEFLIKNNCFSLLASRNPKDKRVPAIWINAQKQPNLGWCWDGNPHTWLGSASGKLRVGGES